MKRKKRYALELWGRGTVFYDSVSVPMDAYRRCQKAGFSLEAEEETPLPECLAKATGRKCLDPWEWDGGIEGAGLRTGTLRLVEEKSGNVVATCPLDQIAVEEVPRDPGMPYKSYVPDSPILYLTNEVDDVFFDSWALQLPAKAAFDPAKLRFRVWSLFDGTREYAEAVYDGQELEANGEDAPGTDGDGHYVFKWLLPAGKGCAKKISK